MGKKKGVTKRRVPKAVKPFETCLSISLRMREAGAVPQAGEESCQRPVHRRGTSMSESPMESGKVSAGSGEGDGRGTMASKSIVNVRL